MNNTYFFIEIESVNGPQSNLTLWGPYLLSSTADTLINELYEIIHSPSFKNLIGFNPNKVYVSLVEKLLEENLTWTLINTKLIEVHHCENLHN